MFVNEKCVFFMFKIPPPMKILVDASVFILFVSLLLCFFFVQVSNAFFRRCSFQSEFKVFSVNTGNAFGDAPIYIFQCLVFQLQRIYFHFDGEPNEK